MKRVSIIFCGIVVALVAMSSMFFVPIAQATPLEPDWMSGPEIVKKSDRTYATEQCVNETRQLATNAQAYYKDDDYLPKTWCIYHYKGFDITFYTRTAYYSRIQDVPNAPLPMGYSESGMAIAFGGGSLVPVTNIDNYFKYHIAYSPNLDRMWYAGLCTAYQGCQIEIYDFSSTNFLANTDTGYYAFNWQKNDVQYPDGSVVKVFGLDISENAKWSSFVIPNVGLARMDNDSHTITVIKTDNSYSYYSYVNPTNLTAITNTGGLIYSVGEFVSPTVVKYTEGCGASVLRNALGLYLATAPRCQARYMREVDVTLQDVNKNAFVDSVATDSQGAHLVIRTTTGSVWYDIYPSNSQIDSQITYLALGDSYSSGEGDISVDGTTTHYLPQTNILGSYANGIPRERCHLSDRSYPFLLARDMQVGRGNDMQSIACSGAVRNDVSSNPVTGYEGQPTMIRYGESDRPRLQGLNNLATLQSDALTQFTPGRIRQIEMVRKYKPRVATITMSGNDVGFGSLLSSCVLSVGDDCSAATDGRSDVGATLAATYDEQVKLYTALKEASPGTDFYAVGYPQFISDNKLFCVATAGSLSVNERKLVTEAVTYFDQVIRNAAATAGIKYIDIEHALDGQNICSGNTLATSPLDVTYYGLVTQAAREPNKPVGSPLSDAYNRYLEAYYRDRFSQSFTTLKDPMTALMLAMQEAFHPNAAGHQAIYDYIHGNQNGASLLDVTCDGSVIICPSSENAKPILPPAYFGQSSTHIERSDMIYAYNELSKQYNKLPSQAAVVERGKVIKIALESPRLTAGAMFDIVIRSDPQTLGHAVVGQDGRIEVTATIPNNLPAGFHTLSLEGSDMSGMPLKFIQTLFVTGSEGDIDGDGIVDSRDTCDFLLVSGSGISGDLDNCGLYPNITEPEKGSAISTVPSQVAVVSHADTHEAPWSFVPVQDQSVARDLIGKIPAPTVGSTSPRMTDAMQKDNILLYCVWAVFILVALVVAFLLRKKAQS